MQNSYRRARHWVATFMLQQWRRRSLEECPCPCPSATGRLFLQMFATVVVTTCGSVTLRANWLVEFLGRKLPRVTARGSGPSQCRRGNIGPDEVMQLREGTRWRRSPKPGGRNRYLLFRSKLALFFCLQAYQLAQGAGWGQY